MSMTNMSVKMDKPVAVEEIELGSLTRISSNKSENQLIKP